AEANGQEAGRLRQGQGGGRASTGPRGAAGRARPASAGSSPRGGERARGRRARPLLQAAATLTGSAGSGYSSYDYGYGYGYGYEPRFTSEARIPAAMAGELMPLLAENGRLVLLSEPKAEVR